MKQVKKLDKELFDSNTKFVSIGTLNEDKIAFISDIDSDIAKKLRPSSDILFWEKWKLFKGKPTERQGRKARRGTDIFWQVSFLYAKMSTKTGRDRFSVYK